MIQRFSPQLAGWSQEKPRNPAPARDSDFELQGVTDLRRIGTVKSAGTLGIAGTLGAQFSRSASLNSLGKVICSM